jgi:hypothetical protein
MATVKSVHKSADVAEGSAHIAHRAPQIAAGVLVLLLVLGVFASFGAF